MPHPTASFYKHKLNSDGLHTYCKECGKAKSREWLAANNVEMNRRSQAKRYNLTVEQLDELMSRNACGICASDVPGGKGGFAVDHCHTTGKVRGILCQRCNTGIGLLGDNPDRLLAAHNYLLVNA